MVSQAVNFPVEFQGTETSPNKNSIFPSPPHKVI